MAQPSCYSVNCRVGSLEGPWKRYVSDADERGIGTVRYPRLLGGLTDTGLRWLYDSDGPSASLLGR